MNNDYHKPTDHSHRHSASGANQVAHILLLVLAMLLPATLYASPWNARDYFRDGSNFDAYSMGQGRIHFKILVFAEGFYYNNNAGTGGHGSRIWTHLDGTNNWENFIYYASDNHICKPGQVDGRPEDKGWASLRVTEGVVVVTNAYAGDNPVFMADNEWHNVDLKRTTSGDHLTYLEFDWYPPSRLQEQSFYTGVASVHHESNGSTYEEREHMLGIFSGGGGDQQPQLMNPIFYAGNSTGAAGYGLLAVPYASFQQTYQYYTSWNPTRIPCTDQSGLIYVASCDSVQKGFYITFETRNSASTENVLLKQWLKSSKVNIPAYHKIYDFQVKPHVYLDERTHLYYEDTRLHDISWKFHYPGQADVVPNDMIEIQRAYDSNFADAITIATLPIEWGAHDSVADTTYHYIDSSSAAWYNPVENSYMVYYRIRRASSAVWGWADHPYAAKTRHNGGAHLTFFGMNDAHYQAADDFATSHKVHLHLSIANGNQGDGTISRPRSTWSFWDKNATLCIMKILEESLDTVIIRVPSDSILAAMDRVKYNPDPTTYHRTPIPFTVEDQLVTPCVHYQYWFFVDTTGAALKQMNSSAWDNTQPTRMLLSGTSDLYFTDAAGLSALRATQGDFPDHVLLTWDATDGGVDEYVVESRPNDTSLWVQLGTTTDNYWRDLSADPSVSPQWQYRVTMNYTCHGTTTTDSRTTTGWRSPYGQVSGRVKYEDGTGCPGVTVVATRSDDGTEVRRATTDGSGAYILDSLPYAAGVAYTITPNAQSATFSSLSTSSASAIVNLSLQRCVATEVDFFNLSSVRLTGRVLYKNSSVPVRNANLLLDGNMVFVANTAVKTDASGQFEIRVPQNKAFSLRVVKEGHVFDNNGYVLMGGDSLLTLSRALDGVRVWDNTKVRLTGRVAGGLIQRDLPVGFGLSRNNLGDNLRLVLELEGDNISQLVRIASDPTKDTLEYTVPHLVYNGTATPDTVGHTRVHYQLRRIIIEPDPITGEFCADLFPVRYKVVQATASGYSTLFDPTRSTETIDLGAAAQRVDTVRHGATGRYTLNNGLYRLTYRSPISITCKQLRYGMEVDYFGELTMERTNILNMKERVPLATRDSNGNYRYLFGAPVFLTQDYDFRAYAHEDYYYNNHPDGRHDQVHISGGQLKIYNGMHDAPNTQVITKQLDTLGQATFTIPVDYVSFVRNDTNVQRVLDLSVESDGEYVELQAVRGYVTGHKPVAGEVGTSTHGTIQLLDVLRDPPGSNSSAYIESGAEYSYSYMYAFDFKYGVSLGFKFGADVSAIMGAFAGTGAGTFAGQNFTVSHSTSLSIPIVSSYHFKHDGSYTFRTAERISTSSSPYNVGQEADVYIGAVQNVYYRRVDAVQPIDSLTYAALSARSVSGSMRCLREGVDPNGVKYYLVIGSELETGPYIDATFAYTHQHIEEDIIPHLIQQRNALLLTCDSLTAQAAANLRHTAVYWSRVAPTDSNWASPGSYEMLVPDHSSQIFTNEVHSLNRQIADWLSLLWQNEAEKVSAIHHHTSETVATYSISNGTSVTRSDNYSYSDAYHSYWDYPGVSISTSTLTHILQVFGKGIAEQLVSRFNKVQTDSWDVDNNSYQPQEFLNSWSGSRFEFLLTPVLGFNFSRDPTRKTTHTRTIGFTLSPDEYSNMDLSIFRVRKLKSEYGFNTGSADTRSFVSADNGYNGTDYLYGSLVYYLRGGETKCPCELPDSTHYYIPKMPISAGSLRLENPKIDISVHEISNVPSDRPALFTIRLYNEMEVTTGSATTMPINFKLKMNEQSNPHGARIYIDGMPLTDGRIIPLVRGQVVVKTLEVYAGDGYDFEDLVIEFGSTCITSTKGRAQFSVHFMPVSCDVRLSSPRDNWVLNTLSPMDSAGYYLPVDITDFDVNYRGFDHIEFQYKISTQSDDSWVNLCSFYADSSRYLSASGSKAMIVDGRIENVRFYGERDPMEQRYDLRAVSFCRHGSGFVSKSSAILTGVKDTRPPRVFGVPLPANSVLGVGDNIMLRFNEPIAGNYLDEDNNFQLLGVTNSSGIASSTSVFFDGTPSCGASSEVTRVLTDKSFTIDLMVKPARPVPEAPCELFGHTTSRGGISFGLMPDGNRCRLYAYIDDYQVRSLPLEPLTAFTRVAMTFDNVSKKVNFYAGTQNVTDPESDTSEVPDYSGSAPLVFGHGYHGNMLEARLWIKALTTDEIVQTHERRLTGYENKLAAYYPMNEGRGDVLKDVANGSVLRMHGSNWTTPSGFSLHMNGTQPLTLAQDVLSRNAFQDYTLMFWFRTTEYNAGLFSAGWDGYRGTLVALENGRLAFHNGNTMQRSLGTYSDGMWHHYILTVNRTFNNTAIYVDGEMVNTFATDSLSGLDGTMLLGGSENSLTRTFAGHFDDLALFEQALPQSLIETYDNLSPVGDEMGIVALLLFSEQKENSNGILEEVFSINNRRIFTTSDGTVVERVQPLVLSPDSAALFAMADRELQAPVRERDLVTKMNFDWSFNQDQLLININMLDREINKNNIYITVRNVEDLNGNRTVSPIMWQVYVNKNTLVWGSDGITMELPDQNTSNVRIEVPIQNKSGRRHQFTIDGLPDWLTADREYGSIDPQETIPVIFSLDEHLPIGTYSEIIYLTDEAGLSEPLRVFIQVKAICPWPSIDPGDFDRQMSLRGQVIIDGTYDSDPQDEVVAIVDDKIVGRSNIVFDPVASTSLVYMTIYGNASSQSQPVKFRLWEASTGHIYSLGTSEEVTFKNNGTVGLPPDAPIILQTTAGEIQNIHITPGWNWISFNIKPAEEGNLNNLFFTTDPFDDGDQIKSAADMTFAEYDGAQWVGPLTKVNYRQMYMLHSKEHHINTQVMGQRLSTDRARTITLSPGWNSMPCLLSAEAGLTYALADYVDHASVGDIIKSQTAYAIFSENGRWEGSLATLRPGEGYLLKRLGQDAVSFTFRDMRKGAKGSQPEAKGEAEGSVLRKATNMTVLATVNHPSMDMRVLAYVGSDLASVSSPCILGSDTLFFITVGSDRSGQVSFVLEEDGSRLGTATTLLPYQPNAHYGSLQEPLVLTTASDNPSVVALPTVFNTHVDFYISSLERGQGYVSNPDMGDEQPVSVRIFTASGVPVAEINGKAPRLRWSGCETLAAGVYFATIVYNGTFTTIKLIKK